MRINGKIYKIKQSRKNIVRPDTNSNVFINITATNIDDEEFFLLEFSNGNKFFLSKDATKELGQNLLDIVIRTNNNIVNKILDE